jgi:hypothetical protein
LSSAPDGTLYVVDMYHGIIQHKGYITEYLRDQILSRKLDQPQGHGRIYRVMHESTKLGPKPALSKATNAQLVDALRIRTAGGAIPRSSCSSSAPIARRFRCCSRGLQRAPTGARGCTRCGRSTASTRSSRRT